MKLSITENELKKIIKENLDEIFQKQKLQILKKKIGKIIKEDRTYDLSGMSDIQSFVFTALLSGDDYFYRSIVKDSSPQTLKELYAISRDNGFMQG